MADITLHGNPVHTSGNLPEVGSTVKDFKLINVDLQEKTNQDFSGKKKIFNIFPSIDTGVCAAAARKFNEKAGDLDNTVVINVSKDLPFALNRFCAAEGLDHVVSLSDFRSSFGDDYGVKITDSPMEGLLSRAVIVADENGKVIYTEQVPEIAQEPNYEAALNALK
ncbi:thiol peroxidase [Kaistella flava (ex Peng et al. 2021)]|uniref:Thiol peroxidase n=1 Tax=Kaistella flava (ex Peng et al. 2021) TaxID=2038776 RepID=A0A7M2Y8S5_9FLAO|nr:thiol peroxidase [Kaistella flava (ex Peng et al. 2021)]QOW10239.1 thiol peroxidase [Kaistella flava (ex Peng et al. 2021)]